MAFSKGFIRLESGKEKSTKKLHFFFEGCPRHRQSHYLWGEVTLQQNENNHPLTKQMISGKMRLGSVEGTLEVLGVFSKSFNRVCFWGCRSNPYSQQVAWQGSGSR